MYKAAWAPAHSFAPPNTPNRMFVRTQFHTDAPGTTISANTSTTCQTAIVCSTWRSYRGFSRYAASPPRWPGAARIRLCICFSCPVCRCHSCPIPLYVPGAAQTPRRMDFFMFPMHGFCAFLHTDTCTLYRHAPKIVGTVAAACFCTALAASPHGVLASFPALCARGLTAQLSSGFPLPRAVARASMARYK